MTIPTSPVLGPCAASARIRETRNDVFDGWIATAFGLAMTGFDRAKRHMFMERLKAVAIVTMTAAVFGPPKGISQWPRNFLRKAHLASLPHWILDAYAE